MTFLDWTLVEISIPTIVDTLFKNFPPSNY
jgi:hypothetical protein